MSKRELIPMLDKLKALPQALGLLGELLADAGYFSVANTGACVEHGLAPHIAGHREPHHPGVFDRFAPDPPAPGSIDPVTA